MGACASDQRAAHSAKVLTDDERDLANALGAGVRPGSIWVGARLLDGPPRGVGPRTGLWLGKLTCSPAGVNGSGRVG
jgi:hypothetical protein